MIVASLICLVPANLLPIMRVTSLGQIQSDTILSGVIYLFHHEMWPLAVIVFVASVFVPLMKLTLLIYLMTSVQLRSRWRPRERTRLYRITEAVGRWSMVDIYVVAILVTMVQLGNLATIEAGPGAVFFAAVVVLTMFAAMAFDPRLSGVRTAAENTQGKTMLIRIVSMLTKLGQRNHEVRENPGRYDHLDYDNNDAKERH